MTKLTEPTPKFIQLSEHLRGMIASGSFKHGEKIPSERKLASQFGINVLTVNKAVSHLVQDGTLRREQGRGTYVSQRAASTILVVTHQRSNPFKSPKDGYGAVARGMKRSRPKFECKWKVLCLDSERGEVFGPSIERIAEVEFEGLVSLGIMDEDYIADLAKLGKPLVVLDFSPNKTRVDSVSVESFKCGYRSTQQLIDLGHREIAFVGSARGPRGLGGPYPEADSLLNQSGYMAALLQNDIPFDTERVIDPLKDQDLTERLKHLLLGRSPRVTAIVTYGQHKRVLAFAKKHQIGIPDRLSLIAYPFNEELSVTGMRVDLEAMGRAGIQLLMERIRGKPEVVAKSLGLQTEMVDRGTCGPPPGSST